MELAQGWDWEVNWVGGTTGKLSKRAESFQFLTRGSSRSLSSQRRARERERRRERVGGSTEEGGAGIGVKAIGM